MTDTETQIMRHFRHYKAGVSEMLFFNSILIKSHPRQFHSAMASLVRSGLVVEERRRDAYSLTANGYRVSLSI